MQYFGGSGERAASGFKRRCSCTLPLVVLAGITSAVTARANVIYPINTTIISSNPTENPSQSDTVSGTITTDGTIGVLTTANILGYDLMLVDTLSAANNYELTPANSKIVSNTGGDLSASASGLFFNFTSNGEFLIQATSPGIYSGYRYFCFSTGGACLPGETISPGYIYTDGAVLTGAAEPVGTRPLSPPVTLPPTPVPEPTTIALLGLGVAGIGLVRVHAKQNQPW